MYRTHQRRFYLSRPPVVTVIILRVKTQGYKANIYKIDIVPLKLNERSETEISKSMSREIQMG